MKQHLIVMLALLLAVFVSGCTQKENAPQGTPVSPSSPPQAAQTQPAAPEQPKSAGNSVDMTASGFSPGTLTISAGEAVTFVNRDSKAHWPASAVHPAHAAYPEPGGCIGSRFDACRGLAQDETFQFTFTHKGSWKYHDHLNPGVTGTIVVS
ncbi:hypothetical protein HYY74_04640 [Candidatus Woesearchaeota archaeon]|nr:hypothetical protein [Candidatus Woesearchaeota archaeon]